MTKKPTPAAKRFTPASAVPFVKRFQQAMLDANIAMPKHGVDGLFGPETEHAFECFRSLHDELKSIIKDLDAENEARKKLNEAFEAQRRNDLAEIEGLEEKLRDAEDFIDESWNFTGFDVVLLAAGSAALGAAGMWVAITVGAM